MDSTNAQWISAQRARRENERLRTTEEEYFEGEEYSLYSRRGGGGGILHPAFFGQWLL